MFKISVLQHACMPVIQGRVALVCVMPVKFLGQGPGQVGSWSGQCGRKNFSYLDHVLNGRCRVCVSELSSPRPELGLAELGF